LAKLITRRDQAVERYADSCVLNPGQNGGYLGVIMLRPTTPVRAVVIGL
jgi:hypothetical protein